MFSFFHRTPTITVDCFTKDKHVYDFTPIVKSTKTHPEWWKELPNTEFRLRKNEEGILIKEDVLNMKNCYGYLELFNNSLSLVNWADLYLEINLDTYSYYVSNGITPWFHSKMQYGDGFNNYHHIKLESPWRLEEKTGVKFAWIGAEWNLEDYNFKVLPGIVNYNINRATNVNIMLPKEEKSYIIPAGLPLVHMVPLTEKNVVIKNHFVSESEFNARNTDPNRLYFRGWRFLDKLLKKDKVKKCPFGFGD